MKRGTQLYRILIEATEQQKEAVDQLLEAHEGDLTKHSSELLFEDESVYQVIVEMEPSYQNRIQNKIKAEKGVILKLSKKDKMHLAASASDDE